MSSPYWSLGWSGHDSCCRLNNFLFAVRLTKVWYCRISSCRIFSCKNILFSGTAWEHENVFFEFSTVQYCCSCVKISVYVQEEWLGLVLDQIRFDGYTVELLDSWTRVQAKGISFVCVVHLALLTLIDIFHFEKHLSDTNTSSCLFGASLTVLEVRVYRHIALDVTAPVTMHLEDKLVIYAYDNFCKQSKFCKTL
jgi:hypothetical protein